MGNAARANRAANGGLAALCALGALMLAPGPVAAASYQNAPVGRVPVVEVPAPLPISRPVPPREGRKRCIGVDRIAGAVVIADRAVDLSLAGGRTWRLHLAQQCPSLSFYQGFYYRRGTAGQLCAGRDAVIARSGGECAIASITAQGAPRQRGRKRAR